MNLKKTKKYDAPLNSFHESVFLFSFVLNQLLFGALDPAVLPTS